MSNDDGSPPDLGKAFEKNAPERSPVSKLEADRLREGRAKPQATLEYTPNGTQVKEVHQQVEASREARIQEIKANLQRAREEKKMRETFRGKSR